MNIAHLPTALTTVLAAGALALAASGVPAAAAACGEFGCAGEQPRLSTPVPKAAPAGAYRGADFDGDGVANARDNCLLVPNPDQEPAVRPAGVRPDPLAREWRAAHPKAAFRTADELGEACSNWNGNWHRTELAQILAPDPVKHQLYRYLGEGGPMFGADRLVYGGPACTDLNRWAHMGQFALGLPEASAPTPREFACPSGPYARSGATVLTAHLWGGKRLFTPTNAGGEIANRFFPSMTEQPWAAPFQRASQPWFVRGTPQTVNGKVIRGRSVLDGRPAIVLDWRAVSGAGFGGFPVANAGLPGAGEYLVYDECRGLSEGIWTCTANADIAKAGGERRLFQFGWMMWQGIDPDIAAFQRWERENPHWAVPEAYGFPPA